MADRPIKRVTKEMLECARLAATGEYNNRQLADYFGKQPRTIFRWLANDAVKEEYRQVLRAAEAGLVARARKVVEDAMFSDKGNGYLALQAAQAVINNYDKAVMGEDKQEVVIKIIGDMPEIGMPDQPEDE